MPFSFCIAANVKARELAEDADAEKQNDYFFSGSMVLTEKHLHGRQPIHPICLIYCQAKRERCSEFIAAQAALSSLCTCFDYDDEKFLIYCAALLQRLA